MTGIFGRNLRLIDMTFIKNLVLCWKNWSSIPPTQKNLSTITKNLSEFGQVDIVTAREKIPILLLKIG